MNQLARIETLHPDIIAGFLETGQSVAIPEDLQLFLKQITWAAEINEYEGNISRAARKLQQRIQAVQKLRMPIPTCKSRIYDAKLYFHQDCTVSAKVWSLDTADKLEDLARLATADNQWNVAKNIRLHIDRLRKEAAEMSDDADFAPPVFLMDPSITAEDLGFEDKKMKKIAAKHNQGYYVKLISGLPIELEEKKQLGRDADITDVDWEDVDNE